MEVISQIRHWLSPETLINAGYLAIFLIVFAESGLFFGFFLPGDSLLVLAGVAAAAGRLNLLILIPLVFIAAILGDQVGYWTGNRLGRRLFERKNSWLFKQDYLVRSEAFFKQHGPKSVVLARFVPIVRTFTPILAGIGAMSYPTFLAYNILGGVLWGIGIMVLGYGLGTIPFVTHYLNYVIIAIIVLSFLPALTHLKGETQAS